MFPVSQHFGNAFKSTGFMPKPLISKLLVSLCHSQINEGRVDVWMWTKDAADFGHWNFHLKTAFYESFYIKKRKKMWTALLCLIERYIYIFFFWGGGGGGGYFHMEISKLSLKMFLHQLTGAVLFPVLTYFIFKLEVWAMDRKHWNNKKIIIFAQFASISFYLNGHIFEDNYYNCLTICNLLFVSNTNICIC